MPRPTSSTTIQRPDLGALAYEYMIDAASRGFICMSIMPIFEVIEKTADYPKIPIESLIKDQDTKRLANGNYQRGDWKFETGTYNCEEYGWEEPGADGEDPPHRRHFGAVPISPRSSV